MSGLVVFVFPGDWKAKRGRFLKGYGHFGPPQILAWVRSELCSSWAPLQSVYETGGMSGRGRGRPRGRVPPPFGWKMSVIVHQFYTSRKNQNGRRQRLTLGDCCYFLADPEVFGLGAFLEMVGILEGLAPLLGLLGVSEVSEQTERASCSSDASEASLPRRLLALLPARLPARLVGPLTVDAPRFGSRR